MKDIRRKEISLYSLEQLALIILYKSGVFYCNQAGGYSCMQPSAEGILSIVDDDFGLILPELSKYTENLTCLSEKQAEDIDAILNKYRSTCFLSIDRENLDKSMEAWLYVNISEETQIKGMSENIPNRELTFLPSRDFMGFEETKGILTWNNSD